MYSLFLAPIVALEIIKYVSQNTSALIKNGTDKAINFVSFLFSSKL